MQTFESETPTQTQALANEVYGAATARSEGNRQRLCTLGFPLALVVAFGLFSLLQRSVHGFGENPSHAVRNSEEVAEARGIASGICQTLTGQSIETDTSVSEEFAFSKRRHTLICEWDVLCNTANDHQYLVRINSRTGQISAINRLDTAATATTASVHHGEGTISVNEAEMRVHQCLNALDIPEGRLEPVLYDNPVTLSHAGGAKESMDGQPTATDELVRCFSFRRFIPGVGNRLIKVSIDMRTGEIVHLWNPAAAL